jgi:hypothetical protein
MLARRIVSKRIKDPPSPHIPGGTSKKRDDVYGGAIHEVRCSDLAKHEYLNEGVPEVALPHPPYVACAVCHHAYAELIGTVGITCSECRADAFAISVGIFEKAEGLDQMDDTGKCDRILPKAPDWTSVRAAHKFRDKPVSSSGTGWQRRIKRPL